MRAARPTQDREHGRRAPGEKAGGDSGSAEAGVPPAPEPSLARAYLVWLATALLLWGFVRWRIGSVRGTIELFPGLVELGVVGAAFGLRGAIHGFADWMAESPWLRVPALLLMPLAAMVALGVGLIARQDSLGYAVPVAGVVFGSLVYTRFLLRTFGRSLGPTAQRWGAFLLAGTLIGATGWVVGAFQPVCLCYSHPVAWSPVLLAVGQPTMWWNPLAGALGWLALGPEA